MSELSDVVTDEMIREQRDRLELSLQDLQTAVTEIVAERNRMREALEAIVGEIDRQTGLRALLDLNPNYEYRVIISHALWQQLDAALNWEACG